MHREITDEVELADVVEQREADISAVELQPSIDAAETVVADVREHATAGSSGRGGPRMTGREFPPAARPPTASTRAQCALAELEARHAEPPRRADEEAHIEQLARWHADGPTAPSRRRCPPAGSFPRSANQAHR